MIAPSPAAPGLNRCLGPFALTAQAVATVGLTLPAVINIPEAVRSAGHATWVCCAIAGYGEAGRGPAAGAVAA